MALTRDREVGDVIQNWLQWMLCIHARHGGCTPAASSMLVSLANGPQELVGAAMESHRCTKRFSLFFLSATFVCCASLAAAARSGLCDLCSFAFAIYFCSVHPDYCLNKYLRHTLIWRQRGLSPALPTQVLSDQCREGQCGAIAPRLWPTRGPIVRHILSTRACRTMRCLCLHASLCALLHHYVITTPLFPTAGATSSASYLFPAVPCSPNRILIWVFAWY